MNIVAAASFSERVALMATLISLVALSIDAMLPALPEIGTQLQAPSKNAPQLVITALLLGLSIGQLFFGPLSDTYGRRRLIQAGLILFFIGALTSMTAATFEMMLFGRFLQGVGAAGPRVVTIAMVRDQFEGRAMARVMSFVMAVFIVVPAMAPAAGQAILMAADWRAIFGVFLLLASIGFVWLTARQPETHPLERRMPLSFVRIMRAMRECLSHPISLGYTLAAGMVFGSFVGFLTSVEQIFRDIFHTREMFPAYFAILSLCVGVASITNARLVMKLGMRRLSLWALGGLLLVAATGVGVSASYGHAMPLWAFMMLMGPTSFCFGILFGNFNALAMEPMGHIAGSAAAVIAAVTSLFAVTTGTFIGQSFDGTTVPMFTGFAVCAIIAFIAIFFAESRQAAGKGASRSASLDG